MKTTILILAFLALAPSARADQITCKSFCTGYRYSIKGKSSAKFPDSDKFEKWCSQTHNGHILGGWQIDCSDTDSGGNKIHYCIVSEHASGQGTVSAYDEGNARSEAMSTCRANLAIKDCSTMGKLDMFFPDTTFCERR